MNYVIKQEIGMKPDIVISTDCLISPTRWIPNHLLENFMYTDMGNALKIITPMPCTFLFRELLHNQKAADLEFLRGQEWKLILQQQYTLYIHKGLQKFLEEPLKSLNIKKAITLKIYSAAYWCDTLDCWILVIFLAACVNNIVEIWHTFLWHMIMLFISHDWWG